MVDTRSAPLRYPAVVPKGGVRAIESTVRHRLTGRLLLVLPVLAMTLVLMSAVPALAGQASTGELFFYPCTGCHPVGPGSKLPNGFAGHGIVLVEHDVLGKGTAACLACHADPNKDPGKLRTIDGSLVDIRGDVSRVCARCHSGKYAEWKAGTHGKLQPACTSAGCHDPHSPGWVNAGPLLPFVGTGFQVQVRPVRQPFMPLAAPSPRGIPPVETPVWFVVVVTLGVVAAAGLAVMLIRGRPRR